MSHNKYFSGGLSNVHTLREKDLDKVVYNETTKLKISNKYVGTSLLLINDFNNYEKWSFSSAYHTFDNWIKKDNIEMPISYIKRNIPINNFVDDNNELILKALSVQSMYDIESLRTFVDPDIGALFTFNAKIDIRFHHF
jgi:hypothetical protein